MIQRYLGNKNTLSEHILEVVDRCCNLGDTVCDIFSGTISMSMAFKKHGYNVISNDINLFSFHFANSYLRNNEIPDVDLVSLNIDVCKYNTIAQNTLEKLIGTVGFSFLREKRQYDLYLKVAILIIYLNSLTITDIKKTYRKSYFFDTYTVDGKNSYFKSVRGTEGRRRFFTPSNGQRLDNILNKIREWKKSHLLNDVTYSLLLSVVCEAVEKISNTQGTYHDFQRDVYDERAYNDLTLKLPPFDDVIGTNNVHYVGCAEDSLKYILQAPQHNLLYIDPPYNFRQYTSYYFMLNLICRYCSIHSLKKYFSDVQFVRGQNMKDDFDSSFCKADKFIPSLRQLIRDANTRYVVLSYYDGRNHENKGTQRTDRGIAEIEQLFKSDMFVEGSYQLLSFERTNYQSFQGHTANKCKEFLFVAEKNNNICGQII